MNAKLWNDFETGGVNPWVHSPLSFAMMAEVDGKIIGEWYVQIRQEPFIVTEEALLINKLDLSQPGLTFDEFRVEYFKRINEWFFGGTDFKRSNNTFIPGKIKPNKFNMPKPAGQNSKFDRDVLQRILGGTPVKNVFDGLYFHQIDTMLLASTLQDIGILPKTKSLKLSDICESLGVSNDEGEFHNALVDLKMTRKAYISMCDLIRNQALVCPAQFENNATIEGIS